MYPSGAHLRREDGRTWGGSHVQAIEPDKSQGRRPSRSVADVLNWDTCEKGLGGRHTPSGMSLDSHRRGEFRGLISNMDGIDNPPTEGLLRSRTTSFRGTKANQQLVRPSPHGSSVDVCVQCSHWTHTIKLLLVRLPKGRRTKGLQYYRLWCDRRNLGTYPARGYKRLWPYQAQSPSA